MDGEPTAHTAQTWQAMATLTTSQRQVLVMAYIDRLTQPEIARRIGVPLAIVRVNVASGLRRLGAALDGGAGAT